MYVEGIFDDTIRILYVLRRAADGIDVSLKNVYTMSLWKLRKNLSSMLGSDIHGWEGGHLRNAIAHLHFEYDESTKKMNFQDINPVSGKVTYNKSLSYGQFSRYYQEIDSVNSLVNCLIMLLRVRNLIISPDVEL